TPDLGLRDEGELGAVDAIDHEEAALVVGLVGLWPLRPVLEGDGHVRAVGREHSSLGDLADGDGIDDARWLFFRSMTETMSVSPWPPPWLVSTATSPLELMEML